MPLRDYDNRWPTVASGAYIDASALVIGDVVIGADSSIWPLCVLRGDVNRIRVGARTNLQDGTIIHVTGDWESSDGTQTHVGDEVTVGHRCILHGCTIESRCLIGMGSIVLDRAVLRAELILGAGSLVGEGKELEGGFLWMGTPARKVRPLSDPERELLRRSAEHYVILKKRYRADCDQSHPARRNRQNRIASRPAMTASASG